ncbi:hypothetical protein COJ07_30635 [Bacillus cereus]|nr:hypothetical protein COJ07_30635 [Bacillus cereus]
MLFDKIDAIPAIKPAPTKAGIKGLNIFPIFLKNVLKVVLFLSFVQPSFLHLLLVNLQRKVLLSQHTSLSLVLQQYRIVLYANILVRFCNL